VNFTLRSLRLLDESIAQGETRAKLKYSAGEGCGLE
jgi:hypothetical protein